MSKGPPPPATRFGIPGRTIQAANAAPASRPGPHPGAAPPPTRFATAPLQAARAPMSPAAAGIAPPPTKFAARPAQPAPAPAAPRVMAPPPTQFAPQSAQPASAPAAPRAMAPPPTKFATAQSAPSLQMRTQAVLQRSSSEESGDESSDESAGSSADEMIEKQKYKKTKKGHPLPEKKVAGNIFEEDTQNFFLENEGYQVADMNVVKENFPGIDFTIITDEGDLTFQQCKNHGKNVDAYLRDIDNNGEMALKFAKGVTAVRQDEMPTELNTKFSDFVKKTSDPKLTRLHKKLHDTDDDLDEETPVVKSIRRKIKFPVPYDVHKKIKKHHKKYEGKVIPLGHSSQWFEKVKNAIPHRKTKSKDPETEDKDFVPEKKKAKKKSGSDKKKDK